MLLFRSGEAIDGWCATTSEPRGEALPLRQVWELAKVWYGNRMDPAYRGRTIEQAVEAFSNIGLTSNFWRA